MYDIRGVAHKSLTSSVIRNIGKSFGTVAQIKSIEEVSVACDARLSSPQFKNSLIGGIRSTGCSVIDLGTVPTPLLYFGAYHLTAGTGIMVTASHNPPMYNGAKMVLAHHSLYGTNIQRIRKRIEDQLYTEGEGELQKKSITEFYVDTVCSDIRLNRGLRVVIDSANGVAGLVAPHLFRRLGCEVVELFSEPDGSFPNHLGDPTQVENLRHIIEKVKEVRADVGLAFDADGDRLVAIAPTGEIIWPDRLMILFSRNILAEHPGRSVVFDVKCSRALPEAIELAGGEPVMWKTGHSLMKSKMLECNGIFGGELSGHLFFRDRWQGHDDGLYAGARLCEILANDKRASWQVFDDLPFPLGTQELRIQCRQPRLIVEEFSKRANFWDATINRLDGIRVDFNDGFGVMRASNTASEIVFRFEADDMEALERIQQRFEEEMDYLENSLDTVEIRD